MTNLPESILTTTFMVNGRKLKLDTAKIPSRLGGYTYETMLLDPNANELDVAYGKTVDEGIENHYRLHKKYERIFGLGSVIIEKEEN